MAAPRLGAPCARQEGILAPSFFRDFQDDHMAFRARFSLFPPFPLLGRPFRSRCSRGRICEAVGLHFVSCGLEVPFDSPSD